MTTTTTKTATDKPRPFPSLKRYLTAILALAYVAGWSVLGLRTPKGTPTAEANRPEPSATGTPQVVWYTELPDSQRPFVQVPPGWVIATSPGATVRDGRPVPVRAPAQRARRVRTRSS